MRKKTTALLICIIIVITAAGCGNAGRETSIPKHSVELNVTATFAGEDGNGEAYRDEIKKWSRQTGNTVNDLSSTMDETFKKHIITDFETGSEPDVLFYFTGADAESFIKAGKVVSVDEIRKEYPEYASNMKKNLMPVFSGNGKTYAVPLIGYWEALFVNKEVLEAAGVAVPDKQTTMSEFYDDCSKVREAGFIPIACALGDIPHYWWEYSIFNRTGPDKHCDIPQNENCREGKNWTAGIDDLKSMYKSGFFEDGTLSDTDDEAFSTFMSGHAAFLLDGSWRVGSIVNGCQKNSGGKQVLDTNELNDYTVTYVPGTSARKPTDIIGGMSMGYYITRQAWDNTDKREAAVRFVEYMTSDSVTPEFAEYSMTALKDQTAVKKENINSLQKDTAEMISGVTSMTGAVQDQMGTDVMSSMFSSIPDIMTGKVKTSDAVAECLRKHFRSQR